MDELREVLLARVPFWQTLGLELRSVSREGAVFAGAYRHDLSQGGMLHGGVLAALIDSACACAAIAYTYPEAYATTIDLQVSYARAISGGRLRAVGTCVRSGGRVLFCEAKVWNEADELVGFGTSQLLRIPFNEQS
jgi:uncharacterized protein (TIGR00369 family)